MGLANLWTMLEGSKTPIFYRRLTWIAIFPLLSTGLGSQPSWGEDFEKILSFSLASSKSAYHRGEPVKLSLTVKNNSDHPVILPFASAKHYDFVVTRGRQELWRWSDGKMFAMGLTSLIVGPQESRRFEVTWLQTDRDGQKTKSGLYEAVGILEIVGHPLSSSTSLQIE